jgi:hypothetical protein
MCIYFFRYQKYHQLCVSLRRQEMCAAGLLEDIIEHDGFSLKAFQVLGMIEGSLFPIGGFVFGAIPAIQAVLSHVFTDRLTYVVSLKPQITIQKWPRTSQYGSANNMEAADQLI